MRCFHVHQEIVLFYLLALFLKFWLGPVAKKKKDQIMQAVERINFPTIMQVDGTMLNQLSFGRNSD